MGAYLGDALNIAHKIKNIYVGDDNNQAKKVIRAYIGDDQNKAKLWFNKNSQYYNTSSIYYMNGTGAFCTIGGRTYTKNKVGDAYVCCFYSTSGWGCPLVVSLDSENCIASDFPGPNAVVGTVTYNNLTWYVSNVGAAMMADPSDQTLYIGSGYSTDSSNFAPDAALELLRRIYET